MLHLRFKIRHGGGLDWQETISYTVFCYSLLSKKHKKVDMGKCRLISELSEEDAKISAFPEDDSVDDDSVDEEEVDDVDTSSLDRSPIQVEANVPSDVTDTSHRDRGGGRMRTKAPSGTQNRYNLRSKV